MNCRKSTTGQESRCPKSCRPQTQEVHPSGDTLPQMHRCCRSNSTLPVSLGHHARICSRLNTSAINTSSHPLNIAFEKYIKLVFPAFVLGRRRDMPPEREANSVRANIRMLACTNRPLFGESCRDRVGHKQAHTRTLPDSTKSHEIPSEHRPKDRGNFLCNSYARFVILVPQLVLEIDFFFGRGEKFILPRRRLLI